MTTTMNLVEFEFLPWPKIARLNRETIVTEKIDGTNAAIHVLEDGRVGAQSRKRLITPGKQTDNYGFAGWVQEHADELRDGLGVGVHFGEWWGQGINRAYDQTEKRFSLFNTSRWNDENTPACVDVVPVLATLDVFDTFKIALIVEQLRIDGSRAAKGFMRPEGVVVYHVPAQHFYKVLLENDDIPKGADSETDYTNRVAA
jgi:hypothetical protein